MIGIYGGSFDPIHIGHLRLAEDVREFFKLRQVIFVPAYISPFKEGSVASAEDRKNMVLLSIKGNPYFSLSEIELKRKGKSYTIDTIRYFKKQYNHLFFIVGTDAFLSLHKWKNYEELVNLTNFIILLRGENSFNEVEKYVKDKFPQKKLLKNLDKNFLEDTCFYVFENRKIDVSSTEIRKRIKEGKSIKYLLLPEVEEYIKKNRLYL